jgi:hypothetical protein
VGGVDGPAWSTHPLTVLSTLSQQVQADCTLLGYPGTPWEWRQADGYRDPGGVGAEYDLERTPTGRYMEHNGLQKRDFTDQASAAGNRDEVGAKSIVTQVGYTDSTELSW